MARTTEQSKTHGYTAQHPPLSIEWMKKHAPMCPRNTRTKNPWHKTPSRVFFSVKKKYAFSVEHWHLEGLSISPTQQLMPPTFAQMWIFERKFVDIRSKFHIYSAILCVSAQKKSVSCVQTGFFSVKCAHSLLGYIDFWEGKVLRHHSCATMPCCHIGASQMAQKHYFFKAELWNGLVNGGEGGEMVSWPSVLSPP